MANTFGKEHRLKGKKVVSEIFTGPKKSVNSFPFRAFYVIGVSSPSIAKFGVSVPKRKFKRAVDRNRIKRLVKEAIRTNKFALEEELDKQSLSLNTMIVFNGDALPKYNFVELKIKEILERLVQSIQTDEKK